MVLIFTFVMLVKIWLVREKKRKTPFDSFVAEKAKTSFAFKPVDKLLTEIILDLKNKHSFCQLLKTFKCNYSCAFGSQIKQNTVDIVTQIYLRSNHIRLTHMKSGIICK